MKFYRGPASKPRYDASHPLVGEHDLSKDREPWVKSDTIWANISKDKDAENQSVLYVEIDESDVLMLHQSLLKGLTSNSGLLEKAEAQLQLIREELREIRDKASQNCDAHNRGLLEEIMEMIDRSIQKLDKTCSSRRAIRERRRREHYVDLPFLIGPLP